MAKRIMGYVVNVRFFVPIDTADVNDMVSKAEIIRNASQGDLVGIGETGKLELVTQKFTSRIMDETGGLSAAPEGEAEAEEQAADPETNPDFREVDQPEPSPSELETRRQTRRSRGAAAE